MSQLIHSFYKHKVYQHAEPQIWGRQNEKNINYISLELSNEPMVNL